MLETTSPPAAAAPSGSAAADRKRYCYAIIPGEPEARYGPIGIAGADVYTITEGDVAAVVSDAPPLRMRPERRHLAAHQGVLKQLAAHTAVLPIAFGTVAGSPQEIRRILRHNRDSFRNRLERIGGKVEMGLRLVWDVPNIFEYFVNTHADLRTMRDRLFSGRSEPAQEEKLEIGRLFERLQAEDRERFAETVETALRPHCCEIQRDACRNEREIMNLACLIGKDRQDEFESAVFGVARRFDNNFAFDFNGPWPPYSFVALDLRL